MRSRVFAVLLLLLFTATRAAQADVSLTDQRTYAAGVARAPLAEGQVPRLIDSTGLEWFINDEVTYATTSSAAGAASDAVFVGAVEATTAGGGTELSVLADAFDGYNAIEVTVDGGTPTFYNQVGSASSDCDGRQIVMPPLTVGGLSVSRKVYVPAADAFARWATTFTNASGADKSVVMRVVNDLGSDAKTTIGATSSGDTTADTSDDWVMTYEGFTQQSSRTPRLAHVLQSPGAAIRASAVTFANGNDQPTWSYTFSVPANGTIVILNFAAGLASRSGAALKAAQLASLPPGSLTCLSVPEQQQTANMLHGVIPTGPEPTGPAGITITSPTLDSTFTASSPFVTIGGLAGPSRLTSVKWESDRGFEGTAQGLSDWTIPAAPLLPGANVFTVTGEYSIGVPISDTLTINLGPTTYQLPEGATGSFFSTDLLIANPTTEEVLADVRFLKEDGTVVTLPPQELAPMSRTTISVGEIPGLEAAGAVSSVVSSASGAPLVVERTMFWDATAYGSHGAAAIEGPRTKWLFGEGSQGFFNTFVLLGNANAEEAEVTATFYPEGLAPVVKSYTLPPTSRTNIAAGSIPELVNTSFSFSIESDAPIVAERSMYFGEPLFNGGHDSPGVGLASTTWYFAEGASGSFFNTFFLLGNAGPRVATATLTYQLIGGGVVETTHTVQPFGRTTINAALDDPALANTAFSLRVVADEPVMAERSMYWAGGNWYEATNAFGVNEPAKKWGLAEGRVGTERNYATFILIGNTTDEESSVRVTFLRVGGGTVIREYTVPANSRFNVDVGSMVPEIVNEQFGAIVEVTDGSPVIVERALYSDLAGVQWAAGTASPAVRLP